MITGRHHLDLQSMPGCKHSVSDESHPYHMNGGMIELVAPSYAQPFGDPDNPNHLVGEKTVTSTNGKTVIKWDLIRDME